MTKNSIMRAEKGFFILRALSSAKLFGRVQRNKKKESDRGRIASLGQAFPTARDERNPCFARSSRRSHCHPVPALIKERTRNKLSRNRDKDDSEDQAQTNGRFFYIFSIVIS